MDVSEQHEPAPQNWQSQLPKTVETETIEGRRIDFWDAENVKFPLIWGITVAQSQ